MRNSCSDESYPQNKVLVSSFRSSSEASLSYRLLNPDKSPIRPGSIVSTMHHRSASLFSTGVPVRAIVKSLFITLFLRATSTPATSPESGATGR